MQVFFSNVNPVAEAQILVEALRAWLDEQDHEKEPRPGKVHFKYSSDGNLRTVDVTLADPEDGAE